MTRHDWAFHRAPAFKGLDPMTTIAILPTAAIEQHGPHLPVGTDTLIMEGMLAELRRQLDAAPDAPTVRILPVQAVGKSNEHLWAPGTATLTAETALSAWVEIGLSVARAGIRKIVLVNSHGGNLDLVSILSRELRVRAGMFAVKCQWTAFGHPDGMFPAKELTYGIHGGDVETSLMLAFNPETVDMDVAQDFASSAETGLISPVGPISYGWIASDVNRLGAIGNAAAATAGKGRATAAHQVAGFVELLRKVAAQPLDGFAPVSG